MRVCVVSLAAFAVLVTTMPRSLRAAEAVDTSYGRIDGDLSVAVGAGVMAGPRGPRGAAELRLRYLWTAGVFATYEDGATFGSKAEPKRVLATGVEFRPLFLARWLKGFELGSPRVDLTLDSLAIEVGAAFMQPQGAAFGARPGLQTGLGIEIPVFARATGLFVGVHGGLRFSDDVLGGVSPRTASDRAAYLMLSISWQQIFGAHVVDLGDTKT